MTSKAEQDKMMGEVLIASLSAFGILNDPERVWSVVAPILLMALRRMSEGRRKALLKSFHEVLDAKPSMKIH
jgi:hypothetical protein